MTDKKKMTKAEAGRLGGKKGGKAKVKKGFATNLELAAEAGRKGKKNAEK